MPALLPAGSDPFFTFLLYLSSTSPDSNGFACILALYTRI